MQQRQATLRERTPARGAEPIATASPTAGTTLKVEQLKNLCAEKGVPITGLKRKSDFVAALQGANIYLQAAESQIQPNPPAAVFQVTADELAKLLHRSGPSTEPKPEEAPNKAKKARTGKSKNGKAKAVGGTEDDGESADESTTVAALKKENALLRKELEKAKAGGGGSSPMHPSPFAGSAALVRFFACFHYVDC